jgi:hypothetical protein
LFFEFSPRTFHLFSGFQIRLYLSFVEILLKVFLTCTWQSNSAKYHNMAKSCNLKKPTLAGHLLDRGTTIVQHMLKTQSKGRKEEIREGKETKSPFISISLEFNLYSHHQEKTW